MTMGVVAVVSFLAVGVLLQPSYSNTGDDVGDDVDDNGDDTEAWDDESEWNEDVQLPVSSSSSSAKDAVSTVVEATSHPQLLSCFCRTTQGIVSSVIAMGVIIIVLLVLLVIAVVLFGHTNEEDDSDGDIKANDDADDDKDDDDLEEEPGNKSSLLPAGGVGRRRLESVTAGVEAVVVAVKTGDNIACFCFCFCLVCFGWNENFSFLNPRRKEQQMITT